MRTGEGVCGVCGLEVGGRTPGDQLWTGAMTPFRPHGQNMRKLWLGWAMGWAVLSGCSRPPVLTIRNGSTATVSNVVVSGTGFSTLINMLTPDEVRRMTVRPRGDSGVRVVFEVGGRKIGRAHV